MSITFESEIRTFAAQLAHDLRSPLAVLTMLAKNATGVPKDDRDLMFMALSRLKETINSLTGSSAPTRQLPDDSLSGLIEAVVREKQLEYEDLLSSGVHLEWKNEAGEVGVPMMGCNFQRVISNLLNNAFEACANLPGKRVVRVSARSVGRRVEVRVEDAGKGIPSSVLPNLAKRGFSYGKPSGSGLGLFSARREVEDVGGSLRLESEDGCGTRVTISLPKS